MTDVLHPKTPQSFTVYRYSHSCSDGRVFSLLSTVLPTSVARKALLRHSERKGRLTAHFGMQSV